jgi:hypothetical protein
VLQQVTGKNSTERFIDKRYTSDISLQPSGMAIESATVYIQTDIACSVRRHVQLPAYSPVAPGPAGYQQRFAQFFGALYGCFISPVFIRNFAGPDGNLPYDQADKYTSRRE